MDERKSDLVAKVPQVTLLFWIIKILATTLGETGGDAVTMSWLRETTSEAKGTGYLIGTAIFGVIFVAAVLVQIRAKKFHPFLYWLTIVATTTVGTTLADYCDRSLGIGYTGGSTILLIFVIASLLVWRWSTGSISIVSDRGPGFDPAKLDRQGIQLGGLGLFNIRERMASFGGRFRIDSAPGWWHPGHAGRSSRLILQRPVGASGVALSAIDSELDLKFVLGPVEMAFRFCDEAVLVDCPKFVSANANAFSRTIRSGVGSS
jgi:hypothetical protein